MCRQMTESDYKEITGEQTVNSPPFSCTSTYMREADGPQEYLWPQPFAPEYWYITDRWRTKTSVATSAKDGECVHPSPSGCRCKTKVAYKWKRVTVCTMNIESLQIYTCKIASLKNILKIRELQKNHQSSGWTFWTWISDKYNVTYSRQLEKSHLKTRNDDHSTNTTTISKRIHQHDFVTECRRYGNHLLQFVKFVCLYANSVFCSFSVVRLQTSFKPADSLHQKAFAQLLKPSCQFFFWTASKLADCRREVNCLHNVHHT